MTDYKVRIVGRSLIDKSVQSPSLTAKLYFVQHEEDGPTSRRPTWEQSDMYALERDLQANVLKSGIITAVCLPDLNVGQSHVYFHKPAERFSLFGPMVLRNSDLQVIPQREKDKRTIVVGNKRVKELMQWAPLKILSFDKGLLCRSGLTSFKENWPEENLVEWNMPEGF